MNRQNTIFTISRYFLQHRRKNYTTSKSFLKLGSSYILGGTLLRSFNPTADLSESYGKFSKSVEIGHPKNIECKSFFSRGNNQNPV